MIKGGEVVPSRIELKAREETGVESSGSKVLPAVAPPYPLKDSARWASTTAYRPHSDETGDPAGCSVTGISALDRQVERA